MVVIVRRNVEIINTTYLYLFSPMFWGVGKARHLKVEHLGGITHIGGYSIDGSMAIVLGVGWLEGHND